MKKKIGIGVLVIILLIGGVWLFKGLTASDAKEAKRVEVQEVKPQKLVTTVDADGTVKADQQRELKIEVGGVVTSLSAEEGEQLTVGEQLIQLKNESLQQELRLAKIDLEEAEQNYKQLRKKYNRQQKIKQLELTKANHSLQEAEQLLQKKKIELQKQIAEIKSELAAAKTKLKRLADKVDNKQRLYQQQAATKEELEAVRDNYQTQQEETKHLQEKLKRLQEETKPAELELARLKVEMARNQLELTKQQTEQTTAGEVAAAELKVQRAETKLNNLQQKQKKLKITTPIKGTVISLPVELGDKLSEGNKIAEVASLNKLVVEAMVDEVDIGGVEPGQQVAISSEAFAQQFSGQVVRVAPAATEEGNINKFETEIKLTETTPLRPGMFVTAEITTNVRQKVIAVPQIAVFGDQQKYIYVVENGKAEKKEVEIGLSNLEKVEVKGVEAGTKVIVGPFTTLKQLKPGLPVKTAKNGQKKQE